MPRVNHRVAGFRLEAHDLGDAVDPPMPVTKTRIEIDGAEVTALFNSLSITAGFDTAVKIELDMPIDELEQRRPAGPAVVWFPVEGTRELLIKHGWTPPAEDVVAVVSPAIETT